jgi:hypothetical protein
MPIAAARAFLFVGVVAALAAVREQWSLMCSDHGGGGDGTGWAVHLPTSARIAMVVSCLCYSAVGVVYGHHGDGVGEALFLAVGVASAIADANLLVDTPLERCARACGRAHVHVFQAEPSFGLDPRILQQRFRAIPHQLGTHGGWRGEACPIQQWWLAGRCCPI